MGAPEFLPALLETTIRCLREWHEDNTDCHRFPTLKPPAGIDWICVSPKAGTELVQISGHELKLVYPQAEARPDSFEHLRFEHFFLQPMDGPERDRNTELAVRYCLENPRWRVSLQTHKLMGIP